jgi:hypothetical protein
MPELVDCRVCDHQISTSAQSCPNCRDTHSIKEQFKDKILETNQNFFENLKIFNERLVEFLKYVWIIIIGVLISSLGIFHLVNS